MINTVTNTAILLSMCQQFAVLRTAVCFRLKNIGEISYIKNMSDINIRTKITLFLIIEKLLKTNLLSRKFRIVSV